MAAILIAITAYVLIGIGVFLWSVKDDHSGSWTLGLPWILPIIVLGFPYLLARRLFRPDK